MIWLSFIALLPALVLSKSVVSADITEIQVCQYFDARIVRFEEKVKEMKELVDVDSEFYRTLEASNLCDTVGRVAVPECVANHEGDDCAAAKIESIKKPLLRAIKVEKSGKDFFDYCKYIGYKNVLKTFLKTRKLMSGECGLPGQKLSGDREGRNSLLLPLLVAGAYDPSSIWFQYFLCKDQQIYCYFFTQGWNQYEYGQYYLYENLLDDTTGIFAGATDSSNLATLALLGGLGGGSHYGGYYPQPGGYSQVPAAQGRKRRQSVEDLCEDGTADCNQRKRRSDCEGDECTKPSLRKRRSECEGDECTKPSLRKRRSECEGEDCTRSSHKMRRSECESEDCTRSSHKMRRSECEGEDCTRSSHKMRRSVCEGEDCTRSSRKMRRSECDDCTRSSHKMRRSVCEGDDCTTPSQRKRRSQCIKGVDCPDDEDRQRRSLACRDPEDKVCCVNGEWICF